MITSILVCCSRIISWIISWQTITIFLSCMVWFANQTNSSTNDPTNNPTNWIWTSKKIGLNATTALCAYIKPINLEKSCSLAALQLTRKPLESKSTRKDNEPNGGWMLFHRNRCDKKSRPLHYFSVTYQFGSYFALLYFWTSASCNENRVIL